MKEPASSSYLCQNSILSYFNCCAGGRRSWKPPCQLFKC